MPEMESCSFCHSARFPDKLNLLDGETVSYNEAYKLCGQCHGKKNYDWESGMHGKMLGGWNLKRSILDCSECHDPHNPEFKPMKASPAPQKPTHSFKHKEDSNDEH